MKATKPSRPKIETSGPRRFFRLTYSNARLDEDPKLFKDRDGVAFCELASAFYKIGYDFGTTIHFYPDDERKLSEFPKFQPQDVLVLATRPPLHDKVAMKRRRKVIHAARTELEAALFAELSKHLEYCTRKHVELTKQSANRLRSDAGSKWQSLELFEYTNAEIKMHYVGPEPVKPPKNHHSTVAFFLRANAVRGLNCNFIASFGMDGYGTLIWNRIIRKQFPHWLDQPGFIMAELVFKQPIPPKPLTPEFIDDDSFVEVRILTR
jgi:hypothetical protein